MGKELLAFFYSSTSSLLPSARVISIIIHLKNLSLSEEKDQGL